MYFQNVSKKNCCFKTIKMAPLPNTENVYYNNNNEGETDFGKGKEVDKSDRKTELLYDGIYYDITDWMKKHPGGKIIEMFASTEQDALHAIQQFHFRSEKKVLSIMKSLPQRQPTEKECKCGMSQISN